MRQINRDLLDDLAKRKVVLFLGAGVTSSAVARSGTRVKDWPSFLKHAATFVENKELEKHINLRIDKDDFLLACEIIKSNIDTDKWKNLLYEEFAQIAEPSELHKSIVKLDQRVILTTNFDKLIENTFSIVNPTATRYPVTINKLDASVFQMMRDDRQYIVKIHGSIDDPGNIIFSKAEYITNAFGNWVYSDFLESLFVFYTVVFIGFSMSDPAVNFIIERYAQKHPTLRPHYIFQQSPIESASEEISRRLKKLYPIPYKEGDDHADLPILLGEIHEQAINRRREIIAEGRSTLMS